MSAAAVSSLIGCSDDGQTGGKTGGQSSAFVCFRIVGDPGPERFSEFAHLVRDYPPAAGLAVAAGYKKDAAVSVKMKPNQDPQEWIDDLPASLRRHNLVESVDVENYDCGEVKA